MSRLGDFIGWLRFGGPDTQTVMRDSQGNEMDPAELETDESEDLAEMDAEQKERARWLRYGRPRGSSIFRWFR